MIQIRLPNGQTVEGELRVRIEIDFYPLRPYAAGERRMISQLNSSLQGLTRNMAISLRTLFERVLERGSQNSVSQTDLRNASLQGHLLDQMVRQEVRREAMSSGSGLGIGRPIPEPREMTDGQGIPGYFELGRFPLNEVQEQYFGGVNLSVPQESTRNTVEQIQQAMREVRQEYPSVSEDAAGVEETPHE